MGNETGRDVYAKRNRQRRLHWWSLNTRPVNNPAHTGEWLQTLGLLTCHEVNSGPHLIFNIIHCCIDCLVPSPVTSLSVTNVSTTDITVNWISPSSGNYVTYYNISYIPSCPELSSVYATVFVVPYTTTYSYTLRELYSGMNYIITVRAGNILGVSNPMNIINETKPTGN